MIKEAVSARKALNAVSLLWLGSLIGAGLAFITQVVLARELTPDGYGVFAAALATVTLLAPLAGFGVQGFWLKVFGAEGWRATRWLPGSFRFVALSTSGTLILLAVWAALGPHDTLTAELLFWLLPVIAAYMFMELVSGRLLLEERFASLAFWQMFPHVARLVLVLSLLLILVNRPNLSLIATIYGLVALSVIVAGCIYLRSMLGGGFRLKGHVGSVDSERRELRAEVSAISMLDVASKTWPFGLATVFHLVYFQSDIVLLKYLAGNADAGVYNVAFTVMAAVYLLPSVIYQKVLLPKIHRWANHDRERFYRVYRQGNIAMLVLGGGAMVAIWGSAFWAIPLLFGEQYVEAVALLNILAVSAPIVFVASSVGAVLVTQEHMVKKVKIMGGVAVLNVLLNIVLIPKYGAVGAAVTTVFSNLVLLVVYYMSAQRSVFGFRY
ncbi:MAG: oligosaccharide flippase family protein [Candidatus Saccharibacteria bacterium]|nr:oligosaccharide flippase family protein [Candidatus Saccharibacteria bacterium]